MRNTVKKQVDKRILDMVRKDVETPKDPAKYPEGSYIVLRADYQKGKPGASVSCLWYDKVGGKKPLKHFVHNPPEWQNLSLKEAGKIAAMFDDHMYIRILFG